MNLNALEGCSSRETNEAGGITRETSEADTVKSEEQRVRTQYREVSKETPKIPRLNDENEFNLAGNEKNWAEDFKTLNWESTQTDLSPNRSILFKILPEDKQDCGASVEESESDEESERHAERISLTEIASLVSKLPVEDKEPEPAPKPEPESLKSSSTPVPKMHGYGYMRGYGIASFFNHEFAIASEYLEKEFSCPHVQIHYQIDAALMRLECDIYREECSDIDNRLQYLVEYISSTDKISCCDLLRWADVLRSSHRHYGCIIICLAVVSILPVERTNAGWYFNLCYYIYVEMSLRVIDALRQVVGNALCQRETYRYSLASKFALESMDKAIRKMKLYLPICCDSLGTAVARSVRTKIAICYVALSYCCNCARFNMSAEKYADVGIGIQRADYCVRMDLLVNKTASFIARRKIAEANKSMKDVLKLMKNYSEKDDGNYYKIKLIMKMKDTISEMTAN